MTPKSFLTRLIAVFLLFFSAEVNAEVLFLAHFDKNLDADYAASGLVSASNYSTGARGGDSGYFPGAPSGAADFGYRVQPQACVKFPVKGNVDSRQGTIDFFVKTAWEWTSESLKSKDAEANPTLIWIELAGGGHIQVYAYNHTPTNTASLAFDLYDGKTAHPLLAGVGPVGKREVDPPWKKDEWHHVAVSWTQTTTRIFADGKLVAKKDWEPAITLPPAEGALWVGSRENLGSRVLIDELRIQNLAVDQMAVPTTPYPTPAKGAAVAETPAKAPWATIPCYRTATPPSLDGRMEDEIWKQIPWIGGFLNLREGGTAFAAVPTRYAICYDDDALYLAVVCAEPNVANLKAEQKGKDGPVFSDDAVEVFIDPLRRNKPYYQMVFNTAGGRYDGEGMDAKWDGTWMARTARGAKEWSAVMRMPLADFGEKPSKGAVWGWNVARDRMAGGGEACSWSPVGGGFHDVRSFGAFRFEGEPNGKSAEKEEMGLNTRYLQESRALIEKRLGVCRRCVDRAGRQMASRQVDDVLRAETRKLADAIKSFSGKAADLKAVDQRRCALIEIGRGVDQLMAKVVQAVPSGAALPAPDLPMGFSKKGGLAYFVTDRATFAVDGKNGTVAGLWDRATGRRCVISSADHYRTETLSDENEADEFDDTVKNAREDGGKWILRCENPDLPGVTLTKEYWLKTGLPSEVLAKEGTTILSKRLSVSANPSEKTLFKVSSRTYFDPAFLEKAYFQRLTHPAIIPDSVKKTKDITAPLDEPGFMGQSTDGCSQFCASDLASGLGVGQFLLRIQGRYAYPPKSVQMSRWMSWGWEMSWLACFLTPKPFDCEMAYLPYEGDHFTFHSLYQQLPEWKELHAEYVICPWVSKTRGLTNAYVGWNALSQGSLHPDLALMLETYKQLMRPNEKVFGLQMQAGDNWGEWPAADGEKAHFREPNTDRFKEEIPAEHIRQGMAGLNALNIPQYSKHGFYSLPNAVSPGTPPAKAGWYVVDKRGRTLDGGWGATTYYTDWSPEWIDYTVKAIERQVDYYRQGFVYFDVTCHSVMADWKGKGRVLQVTDIMEFYRRVHEVCAKRGVAIWVNSGAGAPYVDACIFEGISAPDCYTAAGFLKGRWRNLFSDPMMMMKLYEPPGVASYVFAWSDIWSDPAKDNGREVTNYSLLMGMRAQSASNSSYGDQLKACTPPGGKPQWLAVSRSVDMYHRATMELGGSQIVDAGLRPCWWREDSDVEAYAFRMGTAHIFTCLNHRQKPWPGPLSASRKLLGLAPGKRTFTWIFPVRPLSSIVRQPDPPPVNWDRLCPNIECRSSLQENTEKITVDVGELPYLLVRAAAVTQTPGAIVSAYGQDTQFVLPSNLDCSVEGSVDEAKRKILLTVRADKPCEAIGWWPKAWGAPKVLVNDQEAAAIHVSFGKEDFARFAVEQGDSKVTLEAK
ncbi:MAG: hypothetical protein HY360_12880 [Verrucomicrobia bacterium]|nr:hypothetical protein [Verrucomicrobiota bacterium]